MEQVSVFFVQAESGNGRFLPFECRAPERSQRISFKTVVFRLGFGRDLLLTGFSGTNDGQYLLPLHITQRDPDHQRGTNAKLLSYLLQPENKHYMCMTQENGERRTTHEFLKILVGEQPEIRVLLDVGAQMLDLQNDELAKTWLAINTNASAAIYFNKDDELMVLTRDGSEHLLISSPFAQQLDQCVVYLDDAHTRVPTSSFLTSSVRLLHWAPRLPRSFGSGYVRFALFASMNFSVSLPYGACGCASWAVATPLCFSHLSRLIDVSAT
ncbi:hypothetical protein HD554DRAFT_1319024 [Boletus coccyginus]|nr:hypothetical protein HD554DRAFT_1319024 [Boletus coccyginus]